MQDALYRRRKQPANSAFATMACAALLVAAVAAAGFVLTRPGKSASRAAAPAAPPIEVDASYVANLYDENGIRAAAELSRRFVKVTGTIERIDTTILGDRYVLLKGNATTSLECLFPHSQDANLVQLSPGMRATIIGKCDGKALWMVVVSDCKVDTIFKRSK